MMRSLFLSFFLGVALFAEAACPPIRGGLLELKGGYFFFQDSTLNKIYENGGMDFQLASSFPLWQRGIFQMKGYASIEFMVASGKSLNGDEQTTMREIPLSLGINPTFCLSKFIEYYFTLGPRYFYVAQKNDSPYVNRRNHDHVLGGFVNTGFHFFPGSRVIIDTFGEYSYGVAKFNSRRANVFGEKANIGGFTFGMGLGWIF